MARRVVAVDTETHPIRPGRQAPPVVCVQVSEIGPASDRAYTDARGMLLDRDDAHETLARLLRDRDVLLVGHWIAFDVLSTAATWPDLLPLWLDALEADRIVCTLIREKLIRVAQGRIEQFPEMGLAACLERYKLPNPFADGAKSSDGVRVRFHEFAGIAPRDYPAEARDYALADLSVGGLYAAQGDRYPAAWLADQYARTRATVWLSATSAHGMRTDGEAIAELRALTREEHEATRAILARGDADAVRWFRALHDLPETPPAVPLAHGIVRVNGTKDTKAAKARMVAVCAAQGLPVPVTDKGKEIGLSEGAGEYVGLDADACAATGDVQLRAYARFTSMSTLLSRVDRLALADSLGVPVQPKFDAVKKTGRTSASTGTATPGAELLSIGDQTQNLMRLAGLRECYVARPGCVILSADWRAAELHTLAQTCTDFGLDSRLARVLRDRDAHVDFGAVMAEKSYEWLAAALKGQHGPEARKIAKSARQGAKACNFGIPGGLGITKFRAWAAKTYGVVWTEAEARAVKDKWLDAYPEMRQYFEIVDGIVKRGQPFMHPRSGRYRGDLSFTSTANSFFQGRCGDMLVDAGWRIFAWTHRERVPVRIWNEAHDEILVEIPESIAHDVAHEIVRIMEAVGADWCPIAPVKAEPALQRHWRKAAEPAYRNGRLIPHEDRDLTDDEIAKARALLASGMRPLRVAWEIGIELARVETLR